jgi:hypothetical protein
MNTNKTRVYDNIGVARTFYANCDTTAATITSTGSLSPKSHVYDNAPSVKMENQRSEKKYPTTPIRIASVNKILK